MITTGQILKKSRLEKGFGIDTITKELKISKETINRIESDEVQNNPDIVFYIGHLKSYSDFLDLNTNEIIDQFKDEISYNKNDIHDEIARPIIEKKYFTFQKYLSATLIISIFFSFYILFVYESKNEPEFALIPDLPESFVPIIEEQNLKYSKDEKNSNSSSNQKNILSQSSVMASIENKEINNNDFLVTLKILSPTWIQLRDSSDNIIISKLMQKNDEYSYNLSMNYNITAGNAGNILVIFNNSVIGKIGDYGEVLDSYILHKDFQN